MSVIFIESYRKQINQLHIIWFNSESFILIHRFSFPSFRPKSWMVAHRRDHPSGGRPAPVSLQGWKIPLPTREQSLFPSISVFFLSKDVLDFNFTFLPLCSDPTRASRSWAGECRLDPRVPFLWVQEREPGHTPLRGARRAVRPLPGRLPARPLPRVFFTPRAHLPLGRRGGGRGSKGLGIQPCR